MRGIGAVVGCGANAAAAVVCGAAAPALGGATGSGEAASGVVPSGVVPSGAAAAGFAMGEEASSGSVPLMGAPAERGGAEKDSRSSI